MGYALNALMPKPNMSAASAGAYSSVNALSPAAPTAIIYGKTRVGGVTFYQETTNNNKYLHKLIALAGHEVSAIDEVYLNDELVTIDTQNFVVSPSDYTKTTKTEVNAGAFVVGNRYEISASGSTNFIAIGAANNTVGTKFSATGVGSGTGKAFSVSRKVRIIKHLGEDDQVADPLLNAESVKWSANHRARGVAYLYVRMEYDADAFPNGVPTITAVTQGKKIYNPITETTAWSENPALCLRDYLIQSGVAFENEIRDDLFAAAALICDEPITLAVGGTQKRYTTNGTFTSDAMPKDVLNSLLSSMGGMIWYSQGQWGCKAAAYTSPTLTLNEDDLRGNLQIRTRNSRRDGFNQIGGIFRGPESKYFETNYPLITSATFVQTDGGQVSQVELNLPYVNTSTMAQRIAKISLYRNREQLKISGSFGIRAYELTIGDIVNITNFRMGFDAKAFEVVEWKFGMGQDLTPQVTMTLQEISAEVFIWNADETAFESNNTTLLSPWSVPNVSVSLDQEYRIFNEQVLNVLVVDVESPDAERVDYVEVIYQKVGDAVFSSLGAGDLGRFEIIDIDTPLVGGADIIYEVRARGVNALGVKGAFASDTHKVQADTVGPDTPTNFARQLSSGTIFFSWNASAALDLSYYKLYLSTSPTATWSDGSKAQIIEKIARPATTISYPSRSGTFFLVPYDKSGNAGTETSVVVFPNELPPLGTGLTDTENPTFAGTKVNATILSSQLLMTTYTSVGSSGTYDFTGYLDTLSSRTVRVSTNVESVRKHLNAVGGFVNWDDIGTAYNWDQWPQNWDNWSDETGVFADFTITVQVSATPDNPAVSPVWGPWIAASGEVVGRAFKFRVLLGNIAASVTPLISVLQGTVEY